ncbi:MAG TPA: TIGR00282 family metallophosphoesterase [Phycisphaerae bacterium]|nr:TIGR00282 family metallophosphoesterase [Phycisphaerae bacterium]
MVLKILCVGDVVGAPGRRVLARGLRSLTSQHRIDCNIVNVENTASGSGLNANLYDKLINSGVQLMTMGDHVFRRRDLIPVMERSDCLVRPANLAPEAPGREFAIYQTGSGHRVAVVSLLGRLYMRVQADCPYRAINRVLAAIPDDVHAIVVDMHAEATSEKIAMGWHLDGRVSVVFGTHTHVPTADECILPKGTAYITDVGMTGPYDSVLGRDKRRVLGTLLSSVPSSFDVASGDPRLCGIVVEVDSETGRALSIQRVRFDDDGAVESR